MNKLILIGNGFDLAHGLKTSYKDFILWYLHEIIVFYQHNNKYNDQLFYAKQVGHIHSISVDQLENIAEFKGYFEKNGIEIRFNSEFFKIIYDRTSLERWVDVEFLYFETLKSIVKEINDGNEESLNNAILKVEKLNNDLVFLKDKLKQYLQSLGDLSSHRKNKIADRFREIMVNRSSTQPNVLCLNFNYTDLIYNYASDLNINAAESATSVVNIHGGFNDENNPMIFGFGDEIDPVYRQLENLPENKFRDHIKSFWYLKTENYRKLIDFCEDLPFDVYIMGHSCGLSDRVLLNYIFEHRYCNRIKIFYHNRPNGTNDFFEKTQEISRHFTAANKAEMRKRIISFNNSKSLL